MIDIILLLIDIYRYFDGNIRFQIIFEFGRQYNISFFV